MFSWWKLLGGSPQSVQLLLSSAVRKWFAEIHFIFGANPLQNWDKLFAYKIFQFWNKISNQQYTFQNSFHLEFPPPVKWVAGINLSKKVLCTDAPLQGVRNKCECKRECKTNLLSLHRNIMTRWITLWLISSKFKIEL